MKKYIQRIKGWVRQSLRLKIIAMAIIPVFIVQFAVGSLMFHAYGRVTTKLVSYRDLRLVNLTAEQVQTFLLEDKQHFTRMINELQEGQGDFDLQLGLGPGEDVESEVGDHQNKTYILNAEGVVVAAMPSQPEVIGEDWANRSYVAQTQETQTSFLSDILIDWPGEEMVIIATYPFVSTEDEWVGMAIEVSPLTATDNSRLYEELSPLLQTGPGNYIYLVDGNGRVIYHTDPRHIGEDFSAHPPVQQVLDGVADAQRIENLAGHDTVTAFAPVPDTSWSVVLEDDWATIARDTRGYQVILILLLSMACVVPAFLVTVGLKKIAHPIEALTVAAQEVANGDFDQTIRVETGDEIETLATQFNAMARQLQESYTHLEQRVRERTAQLTHANKKYRAVSELTSDYIYYLNITETGEFVLDWATEAFPRLTGYALEELSANGGWLGIIHPDDLPAYQARRQKLLATEQAEHWNMPSFTYRIVTKGGETRWLRDYWQPLWDTDQGRVAHILGATEDVTAAKEAEEALRRAAEEAQRAAEAAEAANRAKSVFLANMSHELRTPMNAILGYSQLMTRDPHITGEQREYLETIGRSGEHLLGLINDVLTMSKIEAGRITLQENAFDLHRQLEGLQEMFAMRANAKDLALILDIAPDVPRYIQADEGKLRQVLMNLLSNAVKFTEEGGVTLRVGKLEAEEGETLEAPLLRFEVEDTGSGIAPEEMDALFDAFVQTTTGQRSQEGTGLGLPISRQFTQLMGSELTVKSQVGEGTRFRFDLRVKRVEEDEVEVHDLHPRRRVTGMEPGQVGPHGGPYRLLVVEDNPTNRDLLFKLLAPFGFEMQSAANGREGVALWESWQPDLIWMDMRMPVMDGYEATRRIKARAAATGQAAIIVALTASAFEEDRDAIIAAGCDDFVRKPFRERDIFEILTQHLGIEFIYEDIEPQAGEGEGEDGASASTQGEALTPEELQAAVDELPDEWRAALHQATQQLDADEMRALINQIRPEHAALARTLAQWAKDFEYEKIMELTSTS